jgi:putative ABC transport system permease protein
VWRVTLKGLRARKLRFALTGLAVVLGVAFMSGTMTLTATIGRAFDDLVADVNDGVDVQVRGEQPYDADFIFEPPRQPIPASMLDEVRAVDGVAAAEPGIEIPEGSIRLVGTDGETIGSSGAGPPTLGFAWTDDEDLNPFRLERGGRAPASGDEIAVDRGSADEGDIEVGDVVSVLTQKPVKRYEVVGIVKFGTADSPLGASIALFTVAEAQRINGFTDEFTEINVVADDGVSEEDLRRRVVDAVERDGVEIITGEELTAEDQEDFEEGLTFFNTILLVFAGVALLVGSFIIYNTFSIVVAQRMRETALLRALGASVRQVMTSVLLEAIAVGVFASATGFGLGVLLAWSLRALLNALDIDVPGGAIVISPGAVISAFVVGTAITVLAAVLPARRSARVPPVAAMRDVAFERTHHFGRRAAIGSGILAAGVGVLLYGLFVGPDNVALFLGVGAVGIFVGVFVIGPVIARPLTRAIGAPLPAMKGITGTLARENALRNPRRTSATAAALMIGVALVGFITIFAASAKKTISYAIDQQLRTDFLVTAGSGFGSLPFSPAVGEALSDLPELSAVSPLRFSAVQRDGEQEWISAVEPTGIGDLVDLGEERGRLEDLTDDGVAVSERFADDHDLAIGDTVTLRFPADDAVTLEVQSIYERWELVDDLTITLGAYDRYFLPQQRLDFIVMARIAPDVAADEARSAMEGVVGEYPNVDVVDNAQYKEDQEATINTVVNFVYGLLFLAIVIALIGIVNTLVLSIYERTHELGLLRAVGMTRTQTRSSVRWESVIVALLGTALGLVVGLFFGWAAVLALRDEGFSQFAVAPLQMFYVVLGALMVGVLAAVYPAWRASRLDVLRAIATE